MPKIQKSRDYYHITIPLAVMRLKGWKKGTQLYFFEHKGDVILKVISNQK